MNLIRTKAFWKLYLTLLVISLVSLVLAFGIGESTTGLHDNVGLFFRIIFVITSFPMILLSTVIGFKYLVLFILVNVFLQTFLIRYLWMKYKLKKGVEFKD